MFVLVNRVVVVGDFKKHLEGRERGRENKNKNTQTTRTSRGGCLDQQLAHPPTRRGAARRLLPLARGARARGEACCCCCCCSLSLRVTQVVVVVVVGPASQLHGGCHALVLVRLHFTSLHVVVVVVVVLSLTLVWCVFSALSVLAVGFLHLRYVHHLCLV